MGEKKKVKEGFTPRDGKNGTPRLGSPTSRRALDFAESREGEGGPRKLGLRRRGTAGIRGDLVAMDRKAKHRRGHESTASHRPARRAGYRRDFSKKAFGQVP
jgi:hypothetical protein